MSLLAQGDVTEYTESVLEVLEAKIAEHAGVSATAVDVQVQPGSVQLMTTIDVASSSEAEAVRGLVQNAFGTRDKANLSLAIQVIDDPEISIAVSLVPPSSTDVVGLAFLLVGAILLFGAVVLCVVMCVRQRRDVIVDADGLLATPISVSAAACKRANPALCVKGDVPLLLSFKL